MKARPPCPAVERRGSARRAAGPGRAWERMQPATSGTARTGPAAEPSGGTAGVAGGAAVALWARATPSGQDVGHRDLSDLDAIDHHAQHMAGRRTSCDW